MNRTGQPEQEAAPNSWLTGLISILSGLTILMCSGAGAIHGAPSEPSQAGSASAPAVPSEISSEPKSSPAQTADRKTESQPAAQPSAPLARFARALQQLERHEAKEPVRIEWLGDSHAAADFWPNAVRAVLQRRFSVGGPGFVRVGLDPYRHSSVRITRSGGWKRQPVPPASSLSQFDGVFGLGGIRALPREIGASAKLTPAVGSLLGEARWTVYYRLPASAELEVRLGERTISLDENSTYRAVDGSSIRRLELSAPVENALTVSVRAGSPELFGVVLEGSAPGVVVDTLGIDGARVTTPLAWDAPTWEAELRDRHPGLVVISFGTNEAFDPRPAEGFAEPYRELMKRVRAAEPDIDCLLLGPPDLPGEGGSDPKIVALTNMQRSVAGEIGCAFVGSLDLMGGVGSFKRWAARSPAWARNDNVHLTIQGYEELGRRTAEWLLHEVGYF